ncbi:MAG: hypothetical protein K2L50_00590 [Bacteroidales bacterium]|nr:hypothetical protein [Bacteroidales bacterium]
MAQGRDRLYEAEMRANLREREQKTVKKVDDLLSELELYVIDDVKKLEPKERVSLYAKLIKLVITPAANESRKGKGAKGDEMIGMEHLSVFGNVLSTAKAEA